VCGPTITGRPSAHAYNFSEAAGSAIAAGAALRVAGASEALAAAARLDARERREMGARGRAFVEEHRGAVKRLADWIEAIAARGR